MVNLNEEKRKMDEKVLEQIKEKIESIQYGSVTAVVHEGKIVQLDTNVKIRLVQFNVILGEEKTDAKNIFFGRRNYILSKKNRNLIKYKK